MTRRTLQPPAFIGAPEAVASVAPGEDRSASWTTTYALRAAVRSARNPRDKRERLVRLALRLAAREPREACSALSDALDLRVTEAECLTLAEISWTCGDIDAALQAWARRADAEDADRRGIWADCARRALRAGRLQTALVWGLRHFEMSQSDLTLADTDLLVALHLAEPNTLGVDTILPALRARMVVSSATSFWNRRDVRRLLLLAPAEGARLLRHSEAPREAVDEVIRWAARDVARSAAESAWAARAQQAVEQQDKLAETVALLDAEADLALAGASAAALDNSLVALGLGEVVAARLAARGDVTQGVARARAYVELAVFCRDHLAQPRRALAACAEALFVDPDDEATWQILEGFEGEMERLLVLDAMMRVYDDASQDGGKRATWQARIARYAEATGYAVFARSLEQRSGSPVQSDELPVLRGLPLEALRDRLVAARLEPGFWSLRDHLLTEIVGRGEAIESELFEEWIRLALYLGDGQRAEARVLEVMSRMPEGLSAEYQVLLLRLARQRGDGATSLTLARQMFAGRASRETAATAWAHAAAVGDQRLRAEALSMLGEVEAGDLGRAFALVAVEAMLAQGSPRALEVFTRAFPVDQVARLCASPAGSRFGYRVASTAARFERLAGSETTRSIAQCELLGPLQGLYQDVADYAARLGQLGSAAALLFELLQLRPGEAFVHLRYLEVRARMQDATALYEACNEVLQSLCPGPAIADGIAAALGVLLQLDKDAALHVGERALERIGIGHGPLREVLLRIAEAARSDAFAVRVLERWTMLSDEHPELYMALAQRRSATGDVEGEALALAHAVRAGADPRATQVWLDQLSASLPSLSSDAALTLLEARVAQAEATGDRSRLAVALRAHGKLCWEAFSDRATAMASWVRAARVAPKLGMPALGSDLLYFIGPSAALRELRTLVDAEPDPELAGAFSAEAARAAVAAHDLSSAFAFAQRALSQNPSRADALEIAERGSLDSGRLREMSPLYAMVAASALGRFGRRAAHYRAARFFEAYGESELALNHAANAFAAVPSEGATLQLLMRAAQREKSPIALETLTRVADEAPSNEAKAGWYLRAARLAPDGAHALGAKVDLLLRALAIQPSVAVVRELERCAEAYARELPDDLPVLEMRLERAFGSLRRRIEGPDGARVSLAFATLFATTFEGRHAASALHAALAMAGDLEEFATLADMAPKLALALSPGELERLVAEIDKPYANIGADAARLVAQIADAAVLAERGDERAMAVAWLCAAEIDRTDAALLRADAVFARLGDLDPSLRSRLAKIGDRGRLTSALFAAAHEAESGGAWESARDLLQRVVEVGNDDERHRAEERLRDAQDAHSTDLVQASHDAAPEARAAALEEYASRAEREGDWPRALEARKLAAELEPNVSERLRAVATTANLLGDFDTEHSAWTTLAASGDVDAGRALATMLDRAGRQGPAERAWRDVLALAPLDEQAHQALEGYLATRGDFDALVAHLVSRIDQLESMVPASPVSRVLRLRLAAVLEQRLGRGEEACVVLQPLADLGHEGALRYLADLRERTGDPTAALALWLRLQMRLEAAGERSTDVQLRLCRAHLAADNFDEAARVSHALLQQELESLDVLALHIEVLRHLPDRAADLGDALELFANALPSTDVQVLLEAAQVAARAGDMYVALRRAQRAAQLAPQSAQAQLYARGLEYRLRGAGTPEEARQTVSALSPLPATLEGDDAALCAFLLAEALDATDGHGAGTRALMNARLTVGLLPLIALGLAERAALRREAREAILFYRAALAGDLLGLRRSGAIALAAATLAEKVGDASATSFFLECAVDDATTRVYAARRLFETAAGAEDVARTIALAQLWFSSVPSGERPQTAVDVAERLQDRLTPQLGAELIALLRDARGFATPPQGATIDAWLERLRTDGVVSLPPERQPIERSSLTPSIELVAIQVSDSRANANRNVEEARRALLAPAGGDEVARDQLERAVAAGSAEAASALAEFFERDSDMAAQALRMRRVAAELAPGEREPLVRLREAALRDNNVIYARALEHLLHAFEAEAPAPPPLEAQSEQPGMLQLLLRHSAEPSGQVLTTVWESMGTTLARQFGQKPKGLLERVVPGPSSRVGKILESAIRLLDLPRTPVFQTLPTEDEPSFSAVLSLPPSVVLQGRTTHDRPALRYALGGALAAVTPACVLLMAWPSARTLWRALVRAFGPEDAIVSMTTADPQGQAARALVEVFWQGMPPKAQRHIKDLLARESNVPEDLVLERARQGARRVGLFLCGDFGYSVRTVLREFEPDGEVDARSLGELCRARPAIADLYRLAIRPEYADARWALPGRAARGNDP
jgi:hypothetical protein